MILCLRCKRLWPQGTLWCGHCRATLAKRVCPEGHESLLTASSCAVCGSPKLTPGVGALNLRWLSWAVAVFVVIALAPVLLSFIQKGVGSLRDGFLNVVLPPLVVLGFVSLIVGSLGGERGRKFVGDVWLALGKLMLTLVVATTRVLSRLCRRHKDKHKEDHDD